jgi:predicted alpha/beta-fold hydrolase
MWWRVRGISTVKAGRSCASTCADLCRRARPRGDRFIAPRFGYRDALDYYESNAAKQFLAGISRPVLILHALDDPWIPGACYTAIDWKQMPVIEAVLTPGGGHLWPG